MRGIAGKAGLVTGAGSGIGRATALRFAEEGAKVAVIDMNEEAGLETVQMITDNGGESFFLQIDVSQEDQVQNMVNTVVERFGRLDFAHNNAGVMPTFKGTHETSTEDFDRVMAVNARGVFLCMKYEIPVMLGQGGGAIVNTASTAGIRAERGLVAYVGSKHAIAGMTKVAGVEYAEAGVRINAVNPGGVLTNMTRAAIEAAMQMETMPQDPHPRGGMAQPEEIAGVVVFLCSDDASNVFAHNLVADGGMTAKAY